MFKLIILSLFILPSCVFGSFYAGDGGQVVHCPGLGLKHNSSLVALYGQRLWNYTPANLGKNEEEVRSNFQARLRRLNPTRLPLIRTLKEFTEDVQFLSGIELVNDKQWSDEVVQGCEVHKAILSRVQNFPEDKSFLINQDLWGRLTPTTQVTLMMEQILMHQDVARAPSDRDSLKRMLAFLVSEQFDSANVVDFLKMLDETRYIWMDFRGAYIVPVDFKKTPSPQYLQTYEDPQSCILAGQNTCLLLVPGSKIEIDSEWNITRLFLTKQDQSFTLNNGIEILIGNTDKNDQPTLFDSQGFLKSAYLKKDQELKTVNGATVKCLGKSQIEFNAQGDVVKCRAMAGTQYGNRILLQNTDLRWCEPSKDCQSAVKSYFDLTANKGQFELFDFPNKGDKILFELSGFREGVKKECFGNIRPDCGDFILTVKKGAPYLAPVIQVYSDGKLAKAEVIKSFTLTHQEWRKTRSIKVAPSGKCTGPDSHKTFKSYIQYTKNYRNEHLLERVALDASVELMSNRNWRERTYFKGWQVQFNDRGYVSATSVSCFEYWTNE